MITENIHYIEILIYTFLIFGFGFIFGWKYREYKAKKNVEQFTQSLENLVDICEEINSLTTRVVITEENGQFLVHDAETNAFLIQGSSYEEINEKVKEQYPGKCFVIVDEQVLIGEEK